MAGESFYLMKEEHVDNTGKVVPYKSADAQGNVTEHEHVLYFKQPRSGYDNKATAEHVEKFSEAFSNFKEANPDYKLPWGELQAKREPGFAKATPVAQPEAPKVEEVPVVEAPVVDAEEKPVSEEPAQA